MSKLTGNKDIDFVILNQLSDYELTQVCQVNKYVNALCQDKFLWINRLMQVLKIDIETIRTAKDYFEFESYKELYTYLRKEYNEFFLERKKSFPDYLKRLLSYRAEVEHMFSFASYPAWFKTEVFEKLKKRELFYLIEINNSNKELISDMMADLSDDVNFVGYEDFLINL